MQVSIWRLDTGELPIFANLVEEEHFLKLAHGNKVFRNSLVSSLYFLRFYIYPFDPNLALVRV